MRRTKDLGNERDLGNSNGPSERLISDSDDDSDFDSRYSTHLQQQQHQQQHVRDLQPAQLHLAENCNKKDNWLVNTKYNLRTEGRNNEGATLLVVTQVLLGCCLLLVQPGCIVRGAGRKFVVHKLIVVNMREQQP